jgi:hypothetical protein
MMLMDIAAGLGISAAMVTKLKKRGMPVSSVEAADRWRKKHLQFARTKGTRAGSGSTDARQPSRAAAGGGYVSTSPVDLTSAAALARVRSLALLARDALAGNSFEVVAPILRQALQAVPAHARQHVTMPLEVWDKLTEAVPGGGAGPTPGANDFSDEFMGVFWYQVALGPALSDQSIASAPPEAAASQGE